MSHSPDLIRWRADTPGCTERVHLNNAGAALMPNAVLHEIESHLRLESRIGGYEAADERAAALDQGYRDLARLVNAEPRNLAVVSSATAGFVAAMSSFDFAPGDRIVTTRCDYTSNQIQYLSLKRRTGVEVLHAEDLPEGGVDPGSVRSILAKGGCRVVALSWVPTNSGLVQDAAGVGEAAEEFGVPYIVDACQAVGQIPVDVKSLRCDYLSATARKFLRGPRGIGFLYASDRALARGDHPLYVDMRGARWLEADRYEVAPGATRYEEWEHPTALVLGQAAAVRYALGVGIGRAMRLARALADRLREGLAEVPGVRVLDRGSDRCAIVTASVEGWDGPAVADELRRRKINVVATLREYGVLDFDQKGVASAVRLSPHYYNTVEEVDQALEAVRQIASRRPGAGTR
ncbi:MAG: aminotransferase class V-fold PLP-dependent enzyme [Gemmatimonadales bacterium]